MCGITGVFRGVACGGDELAAEAGRMAGALVHRGPDDAGLWSDAAAGVALSFRRLAILELSPLGHQPMESPGGRYVTVFNGEVYNYVELRRELEGTGVGFRGGSDTEVVAAAFERWGIAGAVERFVGMFAMAVWDRETRRLHLVRDRVGIKPLYVYQGRGVVRFASELKALMALPDHDRELDRDALTEYLRYLYVPAPRTIFRRTRKLMPGHILTVADPREPLPASVSYWSARDVARAGIRERPGRPDRAWVDRAEALIGDAVRLRMRSDVPVGAFLSGGIDSSTVVALMQASCGRAVRTYTIGFSEGEYDEAASARRVAEHLGTDHTEVVLSDEDALALVPALPEMFDEPLADPSQLPTLLVSRLARRDVTVALSGDGGDELFGGYNRYTLGETLFERALRVPARPRRALAAGLLSVSPSGWDRLHRTAAPVLPRRMRHRLPGDKVHKLGGLLGFDTASQMYRSLLSAWPEPADLVRGGREDGASLQEVFSAPDGGAMLDRMMLFDQLTYLPDDLLAKVDRASMAVSLEVRVPLLDHRLVEFAWTLPRAQRVRGGLGKWILRNVLYRHVPRELVDRPKMGFSVPIDGWLRRGLRPWAEDLLTPDRLASSGALRPEPIRTAWSDFLAGRTRSGAGLWAVLMFQAWHERWAG